MTCIVGMKHRGKAYIGADSCGSDRHRYSPHIEPKVFQVGDFVIGCTTSFRMIDILKYSFNPPVFSGDTQDIHKYMTTTFVNSMRKSFVDNGFALESEKWDFGSMLIAYKDRLFVMEDDGHIWESEFHAVGSGMDYAIGCLYGLKRNNPKTDLVKALECASNFICTVCAPYIIMDSAGRVI